MPTIEIPTLLRSHTNQQAKLNLQGQTIQEIISTLILNYSNLKKYLLNDQGHLNPFINIYINGKDIRFLNKENTAIKDNDIITLVPAIAGG